MEYKDFFLHLEQKEEARPKNRVKELAEMISKKLDISVVQALSEIQNSPESVIKEWKKAGSESEPTGLLDRIKDSADAPSVGDEVKIQFDEASRGFLTPRQESANGETGTVHSRDEFKTGSQLARYTVEIKEDGQLRRIQNLTPGEVVPTDSNE